MIEEGNGSLPRKQCSWCSDPAVTHQQDSNRYLCSTHFIEDLEGRVAQNIRDNNLIVPHDRIAVAFSGGKDSTALLLLLTRLMRFMSDSTFVALTVDEGIRGYREATLHNAEQFTRTMGIDHHVISFRELYGKDLDSLLYGREEAACRVCGILRRKALTSLARDVGATKIATGHNLDDEAQSVLMNVLRGDLPRLIRSPELHSSSSFIPRIKPLSSISEKEVASYLFVQGFFPSLPECPYAHHALRNEARSMLSRLEYRYPGTMQKLMDSKKMIESSLSGTFVTDPLHRCKECGDPCSGNICQVCLLRSSLGI